MSDADRMTLWPWPEELMIGLTTHGMPTACTAASNSSRVAAKRYGLVGTLSSSAARRRIPSRFMVSFVARAVGTTW